MAVGVFGAKLATGGHGAVLDSPPRVVPALQHWQPAGTPFSLGSSSTIVVAAAQATALQPTAAQFAQDLQGVVGGSALPVRVGALADVHPGDVMLEFGPADPQLGDEGYNLQVAASITLSAPTDTGVFYGTRTLLQMFRSGKTVAGGTARDWPSYPDRGLMLDTAAKFFPLPWLENEIRDMAYFKLDMLHLHLADVQAFRLESTDHPELTAPDHYSAADIRALVAFAARFHVQIVPEIDMPGHTAEIIAAHPDLALPNAVNPQVADLANPDTYTLMQEIIEEFLPLFPGKYWDAGTDEYLADFSDQPGLLAYAQEQYGPDATAADAYYGFVNWVDALVRAHGKVLRIWNDSVADDGTVQVNKDVVVEYWYHAHAQLAPNELADAGYTLFNASWTPTYYVLGPGDTGDKPDSAAIYTAWTPARFQDSKKAAPVVLNAHEAQAVRGADINVWCDVPDAESLSQLAAGIADPLRALAQKTWGSPNPTAAYAEFHKITAALGRAPGWSAAAAAG
ncbi:MAG TPA: family 20 glycosylhydrolase [Actinocrinis sp.]|nr:family 20 glycosylhydrolase [Actinocrinis sp.]